MLGCNQHISHDPLDHINFPMSTWLTQIIEIASKWSKSGSEIVPSWSPMQLNIQYWPPEFHSWSPASDLSVKLVVIVDFLLRRKWLGIETPKLFANALINVKLVGGRGGSRAWGGDLIVFVGPGVGHLTDLVVPGEGIFESFFARRGDIWLPTRTKKTETEHMFPASTLHACAVRFEKIRKSWRPMRTSEGWVDFTVLSSNFVCFSVFLISWTS